MNLEQLVGERGGGGRADGPTHDDPVARSIEDAMALTYTDGLPPEAARRRGQLEDALYSSERRLYRPLSGHTRAQAKGGQHDAPETLPVRACRGAGAG